MIQNMIKPAIQDNRMNLKRKYSINTMKPFYSEKYDGQCKQDSNSKILTEDEPIFKRLFKLNDESSFKSEENSADLYEFCMEEEFDLPEGSFFDISNTEIMREDFDPEQQDYEGTIYKVQKKTQMLKYEEFRHYFSVFDVSTFNNFVESSSLTEAVLLEKYSDPLLNLMTFLNLNQCFIHFEITKSGIEHPNISNILTDEHILSSSFQQQESSVYTFRNEYKMMQNWLKYETFISIEKNAQLNFQFISFLDEDLLNVLKFTSYTEGFRIKKLQPINELLTKSIDLIKNKIQTENKLYNMESKWISKRKKTLNLTNQEKYPSSEIYSLDMQNCYIEIQDELISYEKKSHTRKTKLMKHFHNYKKYFEEKKTCDLMFSSEFLYLCQSIMTETYSEFEFEEVESDDMKQMQTLLIKKHLYKFLNEHLKHKIVLLPEMLSIIYIFTNKNAIEDLINTQRGTFFHFLLLSINDLFDNFIIDDAFHFSDNKLPAKNVTFLCATIKFLLRIHWISPILSSVLVSKNIIYSYSILAMKIYQNELLTYTGLFKNEYDFNFLNKQISVIISSDFRYTTDEFVQFFRNNSKNVAHFVDFFEGKEQYEFLHWLKKFSIDNNSLFSLICQEFEQIPYFSFLTPSMEKFITIRF